MSLNIGHLRGVSDRSFSIFLVSFRDTTWTTGAAQCLAQGVAGDEHGVRRIHQRMSSTMGQVSCRHTSFIASGSVSVTSLSCLLCFLFLFHSYPPFLVSPHGDIHEDRREQSVFFGVWRHTFLFAMIGWPGQSV